MATLHHGDCLEVLRGMADASVDAIVTDPPYGLSFMGKKWDYDVPSADIWRECLRVLKPGGHLLAFAGTRTQHRMAVNIEDAGFEIRDMIAWVYSTGFPKSHNLKDQWQGWGTALKPALEPITMARKPLCGTVAANVLTHGTGGINVDGCRVGNETIKHSQDKKSFQKWKELDGRTPKEVENPEPPFHQGRWPANLIHDGSDEVLAGFPNTKSGTISPHHQRTTDGGNGNTHGKMAGVLGASYGDSGSAARFFYCAKASKADRDEGLDGFNKRVVNVTEGHGRGAINTSKGGDGLRENRPRANTHPTVKPTALMRYLCRLVTPPRGIVLDPFMGSGSTGKAATLEGFQFIGIEREEEYIKIAKARIDAVYVQPDLFAA